LDDQFKHFNTINQDLSLPDFKETQRIFGLFGEDIRKTASFLAPAFTTDPDAYDIFLGAVQGGVSVLPSYSMINFCYTNSTAVQTNYYSIINTF
jgi:hypothetical protein